MESRVLYLLIIVLAYFLTGGIIDYWQSARHHGKYLPKWLNDYFGIIWLLIHSFLLPGIMLGVVTGNLKILGIFIGASAIGSVIWDVTYSILDQKKLVSDQKDYWYFKGKDYGLNRMQIYVWHGVRLIIGIIIIANSWS